jgi:hypothetical protein
MRMSGLGQLHLVLFVLTLGVYMTMLLWSLPTIAAQAGGLMPFDVRPTGYTSSEARAFLAALSPDGFSLYRDVQLKLDLFYPGLLAATLGMALFRLSPPAWGPWRTALAAVAVPVALFDYLENTAIAAMISLGSEAVSDELIASASRWTILKSATTTAAFVLVIAAAAAWVLLRWRNSRRLGKAGA